MTRPGEVEAVEKAYAHANSRLGTPGAITVRELVAAAYPIIAAAVREQVAQEIEAEVGREKDALPPRWPGDTFWEGVTSGKRRAAVIARGAS